MNQARGRSQVRGQSKQQSKVLAQIRRQQQGDSYDDLDWFTDTFLPVGTPTSSFDIDDVDDADLLLCDDEAADTSALGLDEHANELDERTLIHRVTGHRHPRVLFQCWIHGEQVEVTSLFASQDSSSTDTIEEMRQVILRMFKYAKTKLDDEQWGQLIGERQATISCRLFLITQVQMSFGDEISVEGQGSFKPSDRGFGRYTLKFMLLPDGLPITLRLLFRDQRGKKKVKPGNSPLLDLPDTVLLYAVRRTLHREMKRGIAEKDEKLACELEDSLKESLGIAFSDKLITNECVRKLRERFKRNGLAEELPNKARRQRLYDTWAARDEELTQ